MGRPRIMFNMTVNEVREGLKDMKTVIVPVGVVEQHGYHLPLSVDIHNAVEIARLASERSGCFVAPCVHYSFSGGMLPGTINIAPHTFSMVLTDIFRSLIVQGFKNVMVLLGHAGTENTQSAKSAALDFQRLNPDHEDIAISVVPFWELSPTYMQSFDEGDFHAAKYETSMMMYWKPEMVRMDQVALDAPEFVERMRKDPDAYLVKSRAVASKFLAPKLSQSPEMQVGVMGDPASANAELGKQIADECAEALAELVAEMEGRF